MPPRKTEPDRSPASPRGKAARKPKVLTPYQRGAAFERRLRDQLVKELGEITKDTNFRFYVIKSGGSRGALDIMVVLTDVSTGLQRAYGFQCKMDKPAYSEMDKFIAKTKHETGITTFFAYKGVDRSVRIYPTFRIQELLEWKL